MKHPVEKTKFEETIWVHYRKSLIGTRNVRFFVYETALFPSMSALIGQNSLDLHEFLSLRDKRKDECRIDGMKYHLLH